MLAKSEQVAAIAEAALIQGNLRAMTSEQRVDYYLQLCNSIGLNPLTKPFEYIEFQGKLILYPKKEASNQLAKKHGISFGEPKISFQDELIMVSITARDRSGRQDSDVGIVSFNGKGTDKANAIMKAVSKAKRRVVFSMVGLSFDFEDSVESGEARIIPEQIAESLPIATQYKAYPEHETRVRALWETALARHIDISVAKQWMAEQKVKKASELSPASCDNFVKFLVSEAVLKLVPHWDRTSAIAAYEVECLPIIQASSEPEGVKAWLQQLSETEITYESDS